MLFKPWRFEFVHMGTVQSKDCLYFALRVKSVFQVVSLDQSQMCHWLSSSVFLVIFQVALALCKLVKSVRDGLLGFDVYFSINR